MNIAAALLAGGESRRMGRDKALITLSGEALWQRQLHVLCKLHPLEIFVSARSDPPWRPAEIPFVADAKPSCGPLSGLTACLAQCQSAHLLVLAVDAPFMTEDYLRHICRNITPGVGVVPTINGRAEPLSAVYARECSSEFAAALAGDDFSLQTVIRRIIESGKSRTLHVMPEHVPLFRSVNEPADLTGLTRVVI